MAALASSVKKECEGCDCGCCGVCERYSSIFSICVLVAVEELLVIGISRIHAFLAVGEDEWGTINLIGHAVSVYVGNPLCALPILLAGRKLVKPVL